MPTKASNKFNDLVKSLGLGTALLYLCAQAMQACSKSWRLIVYQIVVQPVPEKPLLPAHRGKQFKFQHLTGPDSLLDALPRPKSVIEQRFHQGGHCIAATLEDQFVGCIWLQLGPYREDEVRSVFTPCAANIAWDYDVYVCDSQRLGFLFSKLWDEAALFLREQGKEWTASRISAFNPASLASHKRLGATEVQRRTYLAFGSLEVTFSSTRPWCHCSISETGAPEIKIEAVTK